MFICIWVIHCINIGEEYVMESCALCHTVGNIPLLSFFDTSMLRVLYNFFCDIFYQKKEILKYTFPQVYCKIHHHIRFM